MKKAVLALAVLGLFISCGKKQENAPQQAGPMPYPVLEVKHGDAITYQEFTANLEGQQNVEIRPKVDGFIKQTFVDEGQQVKKGQVLFQLETNTLSQDAGSARAAVAAAQVEVDRLEPLVQRNIVSKVQLDAAKARLAQAKGQLGSISAALGYARITSPADGFVGSLPYKNGTLVGPASQQPLTTVSDTRVMRAYFSMNEKQMIDFARTFPGASLADKIKKLPEVTLLLADDSEYELKGKVTTVNGLIDPQSGNSQFRAEFNNPQSILRSGATGVIKIPVERKNVVVIPQNAVIDMQGKKMVYVVGEGNKVKSRVIKTEGTSGLNFIVSEGLKDGEQIVVEGASKMKDDMEIVPQAAQEASVATNPNSAK